MGEAIITRRGGGLNPNKTHAWRKYNILQGNKSDFIEIVYAKEDTYPEDGEKDGYWYTLIEGDVETPPRALSDEYMGYLGTLALRAILKKELA